MATINGTAGGDTLAGTAANDVINGLGADDNLSDTAGKDTLNGGPGDDTLAGGIGNDTYIVDSMLDLALELVGEGTDTVFASSEFQLGENVENLTLTGSLDVDGAGNELDNIMKGNSGDNALHGFSGNDSLSGNGGDDKLLDDFGKNTLSGGDGNDVIIGGLESDTLNGGNGNDTLRGSTGIDVMIGGKGDDEYTVEDANDKVTETAGQGHDTVNSHLASYTLAANVEDLVLASGDSLNGTGNNLNNKITGNFNANVMDGAAGNDHLTGDEDNDTLNGSAGNDTLDGGQGSDSMTGGAGNDTYIVSMIGDGVFEAAGGGIDTVQAEVDFVLADALEHLVLTGSADLVGTGNGVANKITGNAGKNELSGLDGNDTLDGGAGNDTLKGGAGNDTYLLDSADDQVFEEIGKGKDTILAAASYTLAGGQEIEVLTLQGSGDFKGFGNEFANVVNGNSGSNLLFGHDNNDTLNGGDGNDLLVGGDGDDVMTGGKGNDTYLVGSAKDKITEAANQGIDTVVSNLVNYTLGANFEGLALDDGAVKGTGNTLNNSITGNATGNTLDGGGGNDKLEGLNGNDTLIGGAGNDTLDGGSGADSMKGGAGNDFYIVDDLGDTVSEVGGSGVDKVESSVQFKLGVGVENLTLTGGASITGTGNELANKITGNDGVNTLTGDKGNDTLDGGVGEDILIGGAGNDTYIADNMFDEVQEQAGGGKDTVLSSADVYQLVAEIENLVIFDVGKVGIGNDAGNVISTTAVNRVILIGGGGNDTITGGGFNDLLQGDDDNDKVTGGAGNDTLEGGEGNDTVTGGAGNDYYIVEGVGVDTVVEAAKGGFFDIVESRISSYTLAANVEGLILKGDALNGTGNTLSNEITGNDKDNKLDGAAGNDALFGDIGNDTLLAQAGLDYLDGGSGNDTLKGGAGNDVLVGGFDDDVLFGDAGADFILIGTTDPDDLSLLGKDTINGFETGKDVIVLDDLLQAFSIDDTKVFTDGFVILTKDGANTVIEFDKDGSSGGASAVTLATVVGASVAQSDFEFGPI